MFDTLLTSAKLELTALNITELRGRYPELYFVFDKLEDQRQELVEIEEEYDGEIRDLERHIDRVDGWVCEAKFMLRRTINEIECVVDEDDPEQLAKYTVEALMVDLRCTGEELEEVITQLTWADV